MSSSKKASENEPVYVLSSAHVLPSGPAAGFYTSAGSQALSSSAVFCTASPSFTNASFSSASSTAARKSHRASTALGAAMGAVFLPLTGCFPPIGPHNLRRDRIAYDREMSRGQKEEMLLNIVQLRYADPPSLLQTTQIIAGYAYSRHYMGSIMGDPWNGIGGTNMIGGTAGVTMADTPTVTYQPLSGQQFSQNLLEPIAPSVLLPLIAGGAPIDILLALTVQSIGDASNDQSVLAAPEDAAAFTRFTFLLRALRKLQLAHALTIRREPGQPRTKKHPAVPGKSFLVFPERTTPLLSSLQLQVKQLLDVSPNATKVEIVYGLSPHRISKNKITIVTRSMLSILINVSLSVEVPPEAVSEGMTGPTDLVSSTGDRRQIVIHYSKTQPAQSYAAIEYDGYWYWVSKRDFRSKMAFTLLQLIEALVEGKTAGGAIVTIPTGG